MVNEIVPVNPDNNSSIGLDKEWTEILDGLIQELEAGDDLPDKVIQATELLLAGWPVYKVARKLGTTSETVRRWISKYPTMATVLANGRKLLSKWRMAKLEQQFLTAVERSQEILEVGLDGFYRNELGELAPVNSKALTVIAAQARYMIGLFAGQKVDVQVTHELGNTVLKAREDALAYIAQRLAEQDANAELEPVETIVRVIDAKVKSSGPVLDEDGNPPFGELGVLDRNDDGSLCHLCGKRFKSLARHIQTEHNTTTDEYELTYMLDDGLVRKADDNPSILQNLD